MDGFVVAGTHSGVGKTVATLAVVRALESAGASVQPAKVGPDFIDPSHHERVAGRPSRTLDRWLQGLEGLRRNYHRGDGDVCVVEGVMGLYDGDVSSTAAVAAALDLPVVLVVDASAAMESVAATALGFREYAARAPTRATGRDQGSGLDGEGHRDRGSDGDVDVDVDVEVGGVIAQRAHGGRHERGIRTALPDELAYLGRIPPRDDLEIPDRHLGLHMGDEAPLSDDALAAAAAHVDVDRLRDLARTPPRPAPVEAAEAAEGGSPTGARVAIAHDDAFRFVYPASVERLRDRADVVTFSPTAGDDLPACDGVYLPGGYPERHAEALAASPALDSIAARAADGLPVFGECGGLMALAESLTTTDGTTHELVGVLPATVRMHDRYRALDHVELRARTDTLTGSAGTCLRGHEFHYSSATVGADARFAFDVVRGDGIHDGMDGLTEHSTLGTYAHVHAASGAFDAFVESL